MRWGGQLLDKRYGISVIIIYAQTARVSEAVCRSRMTNGIFQGIIFWFADFPGALSRGLTPTFFGRKFVTLGGRQEKFPETAQSNDCALTYGSLREKVPGKLFRLLSVRV